MKVYISVDLEGITGINCGKFLMEKKSEYTRARKLMMHDLNASIEGILEAGATQILVNDAHGSMRNLIIEDLHEAADLITGFPKSNVMMAGMDNEFDAVIFIGYHAKNGSSGILSHTVNGRVIDNIKINGTSYGEAGINAAISGFYNTPVVMISGDDILQKEVNQILPDVEFAVTKEVLSPLAGKMLNPKKTKKLLKEIAKRGLLRKEKIKLFTLPEKLQMEVTLRNPEQADVVKIIPGIKKISPTIIGYNAKNIIEASNMIDTISNACCVLAIGMY